jgi:hypothetical protein
VNVLILPPDSNQRPARRAKKRLATSRLTLGKDLFRLDYQTQQHPELAVTKQMQKRHNGLGKVVVLPNPF